MVKIVCMPAKTRYGNGRRAREQDCSFRGVDEAGRLPAPLQSQHRPVILPRMTGWEKIGDRKAAQ